MNTALQRIEPAALQQSDAWLNQLLSGLRVNRVEMRRLVKKLEKFRQEALLSGAPMGPCLNTAIAQLRSALDRRGWSTMCLSAPSADALRTSGLVIGIVA